MNNNTITISHEESEEKQIFYTLPENGIYKYEVESISGGKHIVVEVKEHSWPTPPSRTLMMTFSNELSAKNGLAKIANEIENYNPNETIKKTTNKISKIFLISVSLNLILLLFLISQLS